MKTTPIAFLVFGGLLLAALVRNPLHETTFEWRDEAATGDIATAVSGSMNRRSLQPRGLSLHLRFADGAAFSWVGDASMAPVGLVQRGAGVYVVLQAWGQTQAEAGSGQPPRQQVCLARELQGTGAAGDRVAPLFVPTDLVSDLWAWRRFNTVDPERVRAYRRAEPSQLLAALDRAQAGAIGACPDLRRADHL